jgi:ubiquinone/menaquinone biosynthesis C-methylase UbiE
MEPSLYDRVYHLQATHWWFRSRQSFLDVLLRRLPRHGRVLDLGCGPGSMLHYFGRYGQVTGVDSYRPALEMAASHFSGHLLQGDAGLLPFRDGVFSLVAACEVLYHRNVADVRTVLAEMVRVLEPGGCLLVVDSAYPACSSAHDQAAHGVRRFTKGEMQSYFRETGLEVLHATYAYALLLPVVWLVRFWKRRHPVAASTGDELQEIWGPLNVLLVRLFSLEAKLAGRIGLPWGLSIQILGRKPEADR